MAKASQWYSWERAQDFSEYGSSRPHDPSALDGLLSKNAQQVPTPNLSKVK